MFASALDPTPAKDNFAISFEAFFETGTFSDVSLAARNHEELKAHKAVLVASSPTFFKLLFGNSAVSCVYFPQFEAKTLLEVLRFIYCNKIENLELPGLTLALLYAANELKLESLKQICRDLILSRLTPTNVLEALAAFDSLGMDKEFRKCAKFVVG